ncbi:MAG: FkbM family methyltransferase [Acidobacteriota bacterium]|nr:FkbM family methyltransferase [Acidobacteriota bacterium]
MRDTSVIERREPGDVKVMRACLKHWPFQRGKGVLMRLFKPKLNNRYFLMEIEPGIMVPAELDDYMIYWCFVHGYYKEPPHEFSRSLIRPGDTVMDVGANIGLWAMGAALQAGPQGSIHAFEPVAENFARLTDNLALNNLGADRVLCHQVALSDRCGSAVFYRATNGNSGMGALAQREGVDQPIATSLRTLDSYCDENGIGRVDFIKVDVEGAELLVFRGASQLLASADAPAIMFEVNDSHAASFSSSSVAVKTFLRQQGYDIFRYDGKTLEPVPANQGHQHEDLFAFKSYHFERHPMLNSLRR